MLSLSDKQREYIRSATHRYNVKTGATGSGKTYLDILYTIPRRIRERVGQDGLIVLMGNTKGTLQRNIIDPMQEVFTKALVSDIGSDNTARMFGERVYCLGADKVTQVSKIQGASFKYVYCDELTTWAEPVFTMLKSRLRLPASCLDGTCNPDNPRHWFKKFLDGPSDIYQQAYTIDDNPFLEPRIVEELKRDYAGTVYYDRYILGRWTAAEGLIYRPFTDNPAAAIIDAPPPLLYAEIGVDFGGGTSGHAFVCVGYTPRFGEKVILEEYYNQDALNPRTLEKAFVDFVRDCQQRYLLSDVYCDSAEQTLINGLRQASSEAGLRVNIGNALKRPINDRIRCDCRLMAGGRFKILRHCTTTIEALSCAGWDAKKPGEDVRLDDGSTNIDVLDAQEYATERHIAELLQYRPPKDIPTSASTTRPTASRPGSSASTADTSPRPSSRATPPRAMSRCRPRRKRPRTTDSTPRANNSVHWNATCATPRPRPTSTTPPETRRPSTRRRSRSSADRPITKPSALTPAAPRGLTERRFWGIIEARREGLRRHKGLPIPSMARLHPMGLLSRLRRICTRRRDPVV